MTRLKTARKHFKEYGALELELLLEEISVMECSDMVDNFRESSRMFNLNALLDGWYAVVNQEGVIAYFGTKEEAYHYRLDFINRILNK